MTGAGVLETEYPFATKAPQLGTYRDHFEELRMCELPAIYQSSNQGRGLGTSFLKHLGRARLIFFMLEPESEFAPDLKTGCQILRKTIERFDPDFVRIPYFVVINKADLIPRGTVSEKKKSFSSREKVFFVSAKTGTGIDRLMDAAVNFLKDSSS